MKAILLNRVLLVLAFVGLFIAGVLSLEAALDLAVPCGPSAGCAAVAKDPSSHFFLGIPNAYLGLLGYLALAGLAIVRSLSPVNEWRKWVNIGYILATVGTLVSLGLQYWSFFGIHATCPWCLSSAIVMIVSLIVYALLAQELDNVPRPVATDPVPDLPEGQYVRPAASPAKRSDFGLIMALPILVGIGLVAMGVTMKNSDAVPALSADLKVDFVPKGAHVMGTDNSPLTIVEFADLCCPACKRTSPQVKEFVQQHLGKARLVYRHYPLGMHEQAYPAATIAEIAADDNRFWEYVMAVMAIEGEPKDTEQLIAVAKSVGLNEAKVRKRIDDENDPAYGRLARDLAAVKELGIVQTPTFFLMSKGKVLDVVGPNQIMDELNSQKYTRIMSGSNGE